MIIVFDCMEKSCSAVAVILPKPRKELQMTVGVTKTFTIMIMRSSIIPEKS